MSTLLWPAVALVAALLAWDIARRRSVDAAALRRVKKLERAVAELPPVEDLTATSEEKLKPVYERMNVISKDMLELKGLVGGHETKLAAMTKKEAFRSIAAVKE